MTPSRSKCVGPNLKGGSESTKQKICIEHVDAGCLPREVVTSLRHSAVKPEMGGERSNSIHRTDQLRKGGGTNLAHRIYVDQQLLVLIAVSLRMCRKDTYDGQ